MSSVQPGQQPSSSPSSLPEQRYAQARHVTAAVAVVLLPVIAALPPRKLDLYTISLVGGTAFSANYLVSESTGRSIPQWVRGTQRPSVALANAAGDNPGSPSTIAELQRQNRAGAPALPQRETWKAVREKEIKQDVEDGKAFQDMIIDQIWHVWNWGKTEDEDDD